MTSGKGAGPTTGPADRATPEVRLQRDAELAESGWTRRFTGSPPRLGEVQELYRAVGQDVLLDDVLPDELAAECDGCTLALSLFKVVYTRPSAAQRERMT